jgi:hypothetical protein
MIVLGHPNGTVKAGATMTFAQYYARTAALLSDEALANELRCARQLAMQCTRTRRDLALLRVRCLDCELANRSAAAGSGVVRSDDRAHIRPASS